jgi:Flp pilus assembly secretin CpaC
MKKPRLCLALSASLALLQANLLPVFSEPASPSIWQKLAGSTDSKPAHITASHPVAKTKGAVRVNHVASAVNKRSVAVTAHGVATSGAAGQAMLFLRTKDAGSGSQSPAAALTIHPSLPVAGAPSKEAPVLVAMNDVPVSSMIKASPNKQVVAQLAPDQIVAQASDQTGGTTSTPIPPVVSGAVDLEEFKSSNVIDLKISQSRTFKMKNKILRTSISDPSIAEPVVVSENQLVLLGKAPGGATLVLWDDAGNSVAVDLKVSRDFSKLQSMLRQIDPRIVVQPFSVGGSDRVLLRGDVDHPESVIRGFAVANAFMDDRGMKIIAAESRLVDSRIGEQGVGGGGAGGGGQTGRLSAISQVDKYLYFSNRNNNISRAQSIVSDGGRVASLIRVRKVPLIVLHVTFMEMNTAAVRELGVQLGLNFTSQSFAFGVGGQNGVGQPSGSGFFLTSLPGTNGTQGSAPFPFGAGSVTPVLGQPIGSSANITPPTFNDTVLSGSTITSTATPTLTPGIPNIIGFLQQALNKSAQYGAVSSPVQFTAASVIPQLLGNQVINQPISQVGQAVFNQVPALLGQAFLLGAPGGATFAPAGLGNVYTSTANFNSGATSRWSINPSVQGVISHSRARVLAEPTLVTISGERAAFLAGGEIPIPQNVATAGQSLSSVSFEPFGLRLNMIPTLLENGTINLQVSPEERLISLAGAFNLPGTLTNVPAFTTRKTQTIVELKPGQELFISGLVSANSGRELNKTPILGEVPVLGALYRSKAFNKNESELVVAVRPEVILPGNPGQLKLPEEISKVEGPRDVNMLQVEPTVIDERYMSSGRAEHNQKLPGVLPPGSPIPDSQ